MTHPRLNLTFALLLTVPAARAAMGIDMMEIYSTSQRHQKFYASLSGDCNASQKTLQVKSVDKPDQTVTMTVTREGWTGTCEHGLAEGVGTLTVRARMNDGSKFFTFPALSRTTGRMLHGKKIGPWQIQANESGYLPSSGANWYDGLYQWEDALYSGLYARKPDGSYYAVEYDTTSKTAKPRAGAPAISAAMVEQAIQARVDAASGRAAGATASPKLPVAMLADLIPGGLVAKSPGAGLQAIRSKKVAIILSTETIASMRRIDELQAQLKAYAARQSKPEIRTSLLELAQLPDKAAIAREIARALRLHFASVTLAKDMPAFLQSDADYAVVVDFHFEHQSAALLKDFDTILGGTEIPITVNTPTRSHGEFYFVVLDRKLDVVASQLNKSLNYSGVQPHGDRSYFPSMLSTQSMMMSASYGPRSQGSDPNLSTLGVVLWAALLPGDD